MRIARRTALLAVALCAAASPATARADWVSARAQMVAAKVWNDPCGGDVTLWYASPPDRSWRAWSSPRVCTIWMSTTEPWRWNELCPVLMHEYGHLAGYRDPLHPSDPMHSHDPADIMWGYEHYDHRCDRYGRPFLGLSAGVDAPGSDASVVGDVGSAADGAREAPRRPAAVKRAHRWRGKAQGTGRRKARRATRGSR